MRKVVSLAVALCFVIINTTSAKAWFGQKKKTETEKAVEQKQVKTEPVVSSPKQAVVNEAKDKTNNLQEQSQVPQIDQKALQAKRALIEEKRRKLNNTEWQIELRPLGGVAVADKNKEKKEIDTVTFKDNQLVIANFYKKGFPMTNYTLSVQEDGTCVWETMQTSEKSGLAFWRGELNPAMEIMQGILSHHIDDKTTKDFSFVSVNKAIVTPEGK